MWWATPNMVAAPGLRRAQRRDELFFPSAPDGPVR